jgi:hypothetical protein
MSLSHPSLLIFSSKSSFASSFCKSCGSTKTGTPAVYKRLMPSSHPIRILFSPKSSFASSFYINIGLTKTGTPSDSTIKDLLSDGIFPTNFESEKVPRILAIVSIDGATNPAIAFAVSHFIIELVKALSNSIYFDI